VLAPHTDDGELGYGGTISKYVEKGAEVHYAAFSVCEQSLPRHLPEDVLELELKKACDVLGISSERIHVYRYPVRRFGEFRQNILEDLIALKTPIEPELVFLPSKFDTHQDHQVISNEGFRAFKNCSILGYEMPWNNLTFKTTCFSVLEKKHIESKVLAMACYDSQSIRNYTNKDFIFSLAKVRGSQIKKQYAEAFEFFRLLF
jgi:N-acetylglucosamine malate deacetylase 1